MRRLDTAALSRRAWAAGNTWPNEGEQAPMSDASDRHRQNIPTHMQAHDQDRARRGTRRLGADIDEGGAESIRGYHARNSGQNSAGWRERKNYPAAETAIKAFGPEQQLERRIQTKFSNEWDIYPSSRPIRVIEDVLKIRTNGVCRNHNVSSGLNMGY